LHLIEPRPLLSNIETQAHILLPDLLRFQYTFWYPGPNESKRRRTPKILVSTFLHYDSHSNILLFQKAENKNSNNTVKRGKNKKEQSKIQRTGTTWPIEHSFLEDEKKNMIWERFNVFFKKLFLCPSLDLSFKEGKHEFPILNL